MIPSPSEEEQILKAAYQEKDIQHLPWILLEWIQEMGYARVIDNKLTLTAHGTSYVRKLFPFGVPA